MNKLILQAIRTFGKKPVKAAVVVAAGGVLLFHACRPARQEGIREERIPVRTQTVTEETVVVPVRCTGKLYSQTESKLSFKTGGIIENIYPNQGRIVEEGKLLASLKLEEIRSRVRQAELALEKAGRDFKRVSNLYEDSVITLERYQDASTALELAQANLRIARFNLRYSEIRAPSDGKVLRQIAEVNEIVGPGQPVLYFASTETDWVVRVNLTDRDIVRVNIFDSAEVRFDAWRDRLFPAVVREIGNAADPYTGTYEVELLLSRPPGNLVSGFIGRADIFPADSTRYPVLPMEAIVSGREQTATVYVLPGGSTRAEKREITVHSITDEGVIVSGGLTPGEEVVVEGGSFIREGVRVERIGHTNQTGAGR